MMTDSPILASVLTMAPGWDGTLKGKAGPLTTPAARRIQGALAAAGGSLAREALLKQLPQPNVPEAEHLLGVIAHQNGRLGDAIEHVRRAVKLAPQAALFHANLGEMLRLSGRPQQAAEEARRAIEIDPKMAAALCSAV